MSTFPERSTPPAQPRNAEHLTNAGPSAPPGGAVSADIAGPAQVPPADLGHAAAQVGGAPVPPVGTGDGGPGAPDGAPAGQVARRCATCGSEVLPQDSFCEACGADLGGPQHATGIPDAGAGLPPTDSPITLSAPVRAEPAAAGVHHASGGPGAGDVGGGPEPTLALGLPCRECGGLIGPDRYCELCGTLAPSPRDHWTEQPAEWVASSCDRGVRHHRNEDATAVAATPAPGTRAVLVVCDGVSTAPNSDVASLAAARAARDALVSARPAGLGLPESRAAALAHALEDAAVRANAAVAAATGPAASAQGVLTDPLGDASCTFAAAVVDGSMVVFGNVGDSRVYWLPDAPGEPLLLSVDDSVAQERIALGMPRAEAESAPHAHAITRWLGPDAPEIRPHLGRLDVPAPGWLLVCSDGLWNYASEPADLQALITDLSGTATGPLALAEALVRWSCDQGGKDNIGVALARLG